MRKRNGPVGFPVGVEKTGLRKRNGPDRLTARGGKKSCVNATARIGFGQSTGPMVFWQSADPSGFGKAPTPGFWQSTDPVTDANPTVGAEYHFSAKYRPCDFGKVPTL